MRVCLCVCVRMYRHSLVTLWLNAAVCERESVCINVTHIYRYILVRQSVLPCCGCCSVVAVAVVAVLWLLQLLQCCGCCTCAIDGAPEQQLVLCCFDFSEQQLVLCRFDLRYSLSYWASAISLLVGLAYSAPPCIRAAAHPMAYSAPPCIRAAARPISEQ